MGDRVFFVSGFWAKNPVEVGRDPFPPYTSEMGHLHPKVMLFAPLTYKKNTSIHIDV